ncbi:MAG: SUMF1/EgtB/PvdO family nonheme iron enzyme [Bacteroidia bacterium]|nr:SUMF1/EgtB/PvdO family nonheme iron enzyme [Bacteroidia bacterium]
MKKIFSLFLLVLVWSCASEKFDKPRKKPKWIKMETPPGTVWLRDSLYIDKQEIANLDYLQFLWWMYSREPQKFKSMLPDTNCWLSIGDTSSKQFYLRHPGRQDFPVVGVSYYQATEFCKWRSKRVDELIHIDWKFKKWVWDSMDVLPKRVNYRLPTREEWEYAAQAGLDYAKCRFGYESIYRKDSAVVDNWYSNGQMSFGHPMPVQSYWKNRYDLYHMLGNVSELTSDSLIKGLNFLTNLNGTSSLPDIKFTREPDSLNLGYTIKSYMKYEKPAAWLGFRCVCEVLP